MSPPASLSFKDQATKQATVKWFIKECILLIWIRIQGNSASEKPMNPLWEMIYQFLWCATIQAILHRWSWSRSSQRNAPRITLYAGNWLTISICFCNSTTWADKAAFSFIKAVQSSWICIKSEVRQKLHWVFTNICNLATNKGIRWGNSESKS